MKNDSVVFPVHTEAEAPHVDNSRSQTLNNGPPLGHSHARHLVQEIDFLPMGKRLRHLSHNVRIIRGIDPVYVIPGQVGPPAAHEAPAKPEAGSERKRCGEQGQHPGWRTEKRKELP